MYIFVYNNISGALTHHKEISITIKRTERMVSRPLWKEQNCYGLQGMFFCNDMCFYYHSCYIGYGPLTRYKVMTGLFVT